MVYVPYISSEGQYLATVDYPWTRGPLSCSIPQALSSAFNLDSPTSRASPSSPEHKEAIERGKNCCRLFGSRRPLKDYFCEQTFALLRGPQQQIRGISKPSQWFTVLCQPSETLLPDASSPGPNSKHPNDLTFLKIFKGKHLHLPRPLTYLIGSHILSLPSSGCSMTCASSERLGRLSCLKTFEQRLNAQLVLSSRSSRCSRSLPEPQPRPEPPRVESQDLRQCGAAQRNAELPTFQTPGRERRSRFYHGRRLEVKKRLFFERL